MARESHRATLLSGLFQDAIRNIRGDRDDITLLLLERNEGESHFGDAGTSARQDQTTVAVAQGAPPPAHPHIAAGANPDRGFIAIVGSVTWLCSQSLLEMAQTLLDTHGCLTMDLARCEHMDSTCLGTLHEIVTSHPDSVDLQGVSPEVRKLFEELSMSAVLEQLSADTRALPAEMAVIETASLTPQQQGERILSAHETLASLSDENQEQFRAVVDSLRADLPE